MVSPTCDDEHLQLGEEEIDGEMITLTTEDDMDMETILQTVSVSVAWP